MSRRGPSRQHRTARRSGYGTRSNRAGAALVRASTIRLAGPFIRSPNCTSSTRATMLHITERARAPTRRRPETRPPPHPTARGAAEARCSASLPARGEVPHHPADAGDRDGTDLFGLRLGIQAQPTVRPPGTRHHSATRKDRPACLAFIFGPLVENPYRLGGTLRGQLAGLRSARGDSYRITFNVDDERRRVDIVHIDHRGDVYR